MYSLPCLWVLFVGDEAWITEADCPLPPAVGQLVYLQKEWAFRIDEVRTGSLDVTAGKPWSAIAVMRLPDDKQWQAFMHNQEGWSPLGDRYADYLG